MALDSSPAPLLSPRGRFQRVFQESPLPMWVVHGKTLRILAANESARRLYGYTQAEFRAMSLGSIHPVRDPALPLRVFRDSSVTDLAGSARHKRKDGSEVEVEVLAHRVVRLEVPVWLVIIQDLTARKEAERLQVRLAAAEKTARLKDLMVNTVSHELRTPLTGVRGILSTIVEYWDRLSPTEVKELVVAADRAAQVLESTLSDILTLSLVESDAISLAFTRVDLPSLLKRVVAEYQAQEPAREFRLSVPESGEVDVDVKGIELIVGNLVRNAQKYAGQDSPIHLSLDFDEDSAILSVRDFGPGVPADELELIFQPFYRAASVQDRTAHGTGLGLAICRAIAAAHAGSIRAANAGDGGLVVSLKLPRTHQPAGG